LRREFKIFRVLDSSDKFRRLLRDYLKYGKVKLIVIYNILARLLNAVLYHKMFPAYSAYISLYLSEYLLELYYIILDYRFDEYIY
jgi:hypothetical protein